MKDSPAESYDRAVKAVLEAGRNISTGYGHSLRYEEKCTGTGI